MRFINRSLNLPPVSHSFTPEILHTCTVSFPGCVCFAYAHDHQLLFSHDFVLKNCVLVDLEQSAVLAGFASATFEQGWMSALPWIAPEFIGVNPDPPFSLAGDVFSFAMTALEVCTANALGIG